MLDHSTKKHPQNTPKTRGSSFPNLAQFTKRPGSGCAVYCDWMWWGTVVENLTVLYWSIHFVLHCSGAELPSPSQISKLVHPGSDNRCHEWSTWFKINLRSISGCYEHSAWCQTKITVNLRFISTSCGQVKMNITHRPVVSGKWLIVWERFWQHWIFVTGILKTVVFIYL